MKVYRNVTLHLQVECEISDKDKDSILKELKKSDFTKWYNARRKLLELSDWVAEDKVKQIYHFIEEANLGVYVPAIDAYEITDQIQNEEGREI